ncbi:hypothetical protein HZS_5897 [Henneguya salminicola]|nr:hypothetical protein HZS_5897 [Henneguya salminicola]
MAIAFISIAKTSTEIAFLCLFVNFTFIPIYVPFFLEIASIDLIRFDTNLKELLAAKKNKLGRTVEKLLRERNLQKLMVFFEKNDNIFNEFVTGCLRETL